MKNDERTRQRVMGAAENIESAIILLECVRAKLGEASVLLFPPAGTALSSPLAGEHLSDTAREYGQRADEFGDRLADLADQLAKITMTQKTEAA